MRNEISAAEEDDPDVAHGVGALRSAEAPGPVDEVGQAGHHRFEDDLEITGIGLPVRVRCHDVAGAVLAGDPVAEPQSSPLAPVDRGDAGVVTGVAHHRCGAVVLAVDDHEQGDRLPADLLRHARDDLRDIGNLLVRRHDDRHRGHLERALGGHEILDGGTIDQLVDLALAAPSARAHTGRPGEDAASISVAVTWRSVAARGKP